MMDVKLLDWKLYSSPHTPTTGYATGEIWSHGPVELSELPDKLLELVRAQVSLKPWESLEAEDWNIDRHSEVNMDGPFMTAPTVTIQLVINVDWDARKNYELVHRAPEKSDIAEFDQAFWNRV